MKHLGICLLSFLLVTPFTAVSAFTARGPTGASSLLQAPIAVRGQPLYYSTNSTIAGGGRTLSLPRTAPIEERLIRLCQIEDDDERRKKFEIFLSEKIVEEQNLQKSNRVHQQPKSPPLWNRKRSPFVKQVQDRLRSLGTAIQEDAWEKYVISGFQAPTSKKSQLWACVDMTVQFQVVARKFDEEELKP